MNRLLVLLLWVAGPAFAADRVVIHAGTLIDGVSKRPRTEVTVVVEGGLVAEVAPGFRAPAEGETLIDLSDRTVLPGLMDMHTHLSGELSPESYSEWIYMDPTDEVLRATVYARRTLEAGFTTVRDVGDDGMVVRSLRDAIAKGWVEGPRIYTAGKYEIKPTDLVFVFVPLIIAGIVTGRLKGLDMFGVKADLSALWAEAADTKIEEQISSAPNSSVGDVMEFVNTASKGGVAEIPRLIANKTNALSFTLGMGGYYGRAISEYFDRLYGSSYLRYVIVNNADESLFGIYPAADLIAYLRAAGPDAYAQFEGSLNRADPQSQEWLTQLPGFISAKSALSANVSKRDALQAMADLEVESLPVVDAGQRFIGTVERSKLTTSLVLAVTDRVAAKGGE